MVGSGGLFYCAALVRVLIVHNAARCYARRHRPAGRLASAQSNMATELSSTLSDATADSRPSSIFRNRNFILLWMAYTTSALGDHLSEMALLHMQGATQRADSTRVSAIMLFQFMLPFFLFGPVMGWLADRLPRKRIMITADLVRSVVMFSFLVILHAVFDRFAGANWRAVLERDGRFPALDPWLYALPLFVLGTFAAMFSPARAAMLPSLIRQDQIIRGNGLMNAMGPIATIASYLIGAQIIAAYANRGPGILFTLNGFTFLISALTIILILPPRRQAAIAAGPRERSGLLDGFAYCRGHRRVVELIAFAVVFWTAAAAVRSVVPAVVGHVGGTVDDIGYFNASLGIGMLSGAMLLALLGDRLKSELALSWSLVGASLSVASLAIAWQGGLGHLSFYAGLFLTGVFGSGVLVSVYALIMKIVPDFFRGRVFGVKDLTSIGGLLLATGFLGIPRWKNIDEYTPLILCLVAAGLLATGVTAIYIRLRRGRFGPVLSFWKNLNDFGCRLLPRARREGLCTIPASGPAIVVANHNSTLDPFVLTSASPNRIIGFMIAAEFARIPLFSRLVRVIDCVPVTRSGQDTASIKAALRHLQEGKLLGIFPQGGVRDPSAPIEVREGVGMLALRSGVPVIPAYIAGLKYTEKVIAPFFWRHNAVVRFGPPVDLSKWAGREKDREAFREVAQHVMAAIMALKPK